MEIGRLFEQKQIQNLLHQVLENETTFYQESNFSNHDKKYGYNQYSLLIIVDFLIKYEIIIQDDSLLNECVNQLHQIIQTYQNHQDLVISCNQLLGEIVRQKLYLSNIHDAQNKKIILQYIYDRYIVHGYLFYSFPSIDNMIIAQSGIIPLTYQERINDLKKVTHIFSHHKYSSMIPKTYLQKKTFVTLTDSPAMAYFDAINSPSYLSILGATSSYYQATSYDLEAYYRHDKEACYQNLYQLCQHVRLSEKETNTVLSTFEKLWNEIDASNLIPTIAFVQRKVMNKHQLADIEEILENSKTEALEISIARIIDSRFSTIRRYVPIPINHFSIYQLPTYQSIKQIKTEKISNVIKENPVEEFVINSPEKLTHSNSYAQVIALLGIFLIALGMMLIVILGG